MRSQQEFLKDLVARLDRHGIPYMITGSLVSSFHGEPRATNDIDIVIHPMPARLDAFVHGLGENYHVNVEAAREALTSRRMFNVIDARGTWKADLIIRKDRPFSVTEFDRRRLERLPDAPVYLASPEDVLLCKLEWAAKSGSERQFRDAVGIILGQGKTLDTAYLHRWAPDLGVAPQLEQAFSEAARHRES
jgi:hypothetical protein